VLAVATVAAVGDQSPRHRPGREVLGVGSQGVAQVPVDRRAVGKREHEEHVGRAGAGLDLAGPALESASVAGEEPGEVVDVLLE
jgi:hypothetical protein